MSRRIYNCRRRDCAVTFDSLREMWSVRGPAVGHYVLHFCSDDCLFLWAQECVES